MNAKFIIIRRSTKLVNKSYQLRVNMEFSSVMDFFDLNQVSIKGVNSITAKDDLIIHLEPYSIVNPHYECGGFSENWQQEVFLQYYYGSFNYIGSNESYQIEMINFDQDSTLFLCYKDFTFSSQTRIDQMCKIFPASCKSRILEKRAPDHEIVRVALYPISDNLVHFYFKKWPIG
ncbi:MAG: hypothetical protein U5L72_18125 [Bacteroidales bacterium]|nr:hypothetical protein [Bacteroidales bacterium]